RFSGHGIRLASNANMIKGNYIGTDVTGTAVLRNFGDGVFIDGAADNTIGGSTAAERNIISGNGSNRGEIVGSGAQGNVVIGNYIGTDVTGTSRFLGNFNDGVRIAAPNNVVGRNAHTPGRCDRACNLISGNTGSAGVEIRDSGNLVQGNFIGTDFRGTAAIINGGHGVLIDSDTEAADNTIDGPAADGSGNLISGNGQAYNGDGVHIGLHGTNNLVAGNL